MIAKRLMTAYRGKLDKALSYLEYSLRKVENLSCDPESLDPESLETWESFAARFARVADIFLTKYIRAIVLQEDPGFEGTLRDLLNQAEKMGVIDQADAWLEIRELRNMAAHDYTDEQLETYFQRIRTLAPRLLKIRSLLDD